jgi:hypothetical protein
MRASFNLKQTWFFHLFVIGLYGFTVFFLIKHVQAIVDIKVHNLYLIDYLDLGYFPIPPGYYFLIYILDFVFYYKYPFVVSSFLVITFFLWWKYYLLYLWVVKELPFRPIIVFSISFTFLFLSPIFIPAIDGDFWYLGKLTQTIWHNSTLIASFPFCILLFKKTFDWFEKKKSADFYYLIALSITILLIKPSFLFCYVPALPIYAFLKEKKLSHPFWHSFKLSLVVLVLILLEKFLIFSWDPMIPEIYSSAERSEVVINPFFVWLHFSDQPIFDFLSSIPLILIYLILWGKKAFESQYFTLSFLLFFFALFIYAVFAESGFRELHGNFYWQIPIALFLTHLSIVFAVGKSYFDNTGKPTIKMIVLSVIYLIQFGFGLAYWFRLFIGLTLS